MKEHWTDRQTDRQTDKGLGQIPREKPGINVHRYKLGESKCKPNSTTEITSKIKVNQSRYRPGEAQRVPGS